MMQLPDHFTCAACKGHFLSDTPYADRVAKFEADTGIILKPGEETSSVCQICYDKIVQERREAGLLSMAPAPAVLN